MRDMQVGRDICAGGLPSCETGAMACLSSPTAVGSLDSIRGIVKVAGFVNSVEGLERNHRLLMGHLTC